MPIITNISEQKRRPSRRNIFLDGSFSFGCNVNVVVRFRLRVGMMLSEEQVREIQLGEVKQECFDKAMASLSTRLHSRAELEKKLIRQEYGAAVVEAVMEDLDRLGYINDDAFARQKAQSAAQYKHHGRRRAHQELMKSGVKTDVAEAALDSVYDAHDSTAVARRLAEKKAPALRKLDPHVARRRLVGMLQRRGFDYDAIKPVVDEILGQDRLNE